MIIENGSVRNRPPRLQEINACLPWLQQQLDIIQPLVVLCLGAPSANLIIHRDFRMMKERGLWFPSTYAKYAIAALHPAYILRQDAETFAASRKMLVDDIAAARTKVIEAKNEPKATLF